MGIVIADVMARLKTQVTDLRSVEGVADFTTLLKQNALPQQTPAAHVVPTGIRGGKPETATGVFTQPTSEAVAVILTVRTNDQAGESALGAVDALIESTIAALAGWAPNDELGVFQLERGSVLDLSADALVYQLEFSISDQLRITS
ncbi:hypothetical protein [Pacificibacter sp. AS14]|uniref:phage tail terminator protein n=1 Tax=Pacificibacter sp. AS14 TaxID=3135785 RepID=UPI00316D237B